MASGYAASLINFRGHLLAEMSRRGHRVHASAPEFLPGELRALTALGVTAHALPMDRTGMNPVADLAYVGRMVSLCRSLRPDLVLAYTIKPVTLGLFAARMAHVKRRYALITGLGYAFTDRTSRNWLGALAREMYRVALAGASQVFFQNRDDAAHFRSENLVRETEVTVLNGSGVDLEYFGEREPPPPSQLSFLMIARLLGDKGVREYVAAAGMIKSEFPETEFSLAGSIDSNPSAISADELSGWERSGIIHYLGQLSDVRPALEASSVYVLPSYREGTPRTVLEAMATGRAVITTDAPGCRETVQEGVNGFLVPPRTVKPLADAMREFVRDRELIGRMGKASRRIAEAKFNVEDVSGSMLRVMQL